MEKRIVRKEGKRMNKIKKLKNLKKVKKAMLYIRHWAKKNNIEYVSFSTFPFGTRNTITKEVSPETSIGMTYVLKGAEKWKEGHEGVIIRNDYFRNIYIDLNSKEAKEILKEFKG